jgi:hypothetical protein
MALTAVPVKFAPFAPDLSDYDPNYSDALMNVEPHADGYGPIRGWSQSLTSTLGAACKGAITVRLATGSTAIYAGTTTKLYKLDSSDLSWDDVSRLVGGDYAVAANTYWSFYQYGSYLIACNGVDATQYIDVDSGTNFAALANAPIAKYVSSLGDHLLLLSLSTDARAIAWSGVNDATYWTYGYRGSDTQTLPDGGDVMGAVPVNNGAVVFQKDKIRIIERVGGNYVWGIRILHENLGCFAPWSIIPVRNTFMWYDQAGYYMGVEGKPIGAERVDFFARTSSDETKLVRMRGTTDPARNMAWWLIDKADGTTFMLGYDWVVDQWTQSDSNLDIIFRAISPGYTIDGLATLGYTTIDSLPYPVDSPFWQGTGIQTLAGFSTTGAFGYFLDGFMEATLETVDMEYSKGGSAFINALRLDSDCPYSSVTAQVGTRRYPGETAAWSASTAVDDDTGRAWIRAMGATHRLRFTIAEDAQWDHADGGTIWLKKAGARA